MNPGRLQLRDRLAQRDEGILQMLQDVTEGDNVEQLVVDLLPGTGVVDVSDDHVVGPLFRQLGRLRIDLHSDDFQPCSTRTLVKYPAAQPTSRTALLCPTIVRAKACVLFSALGSTVKRYREFHLTRSLAEHSASRCREGIPAQNTLAVYPAPSGSSPNGPAWTE